ncbi:TPA: hypothetical protein P5S08_004599 [Salmonella enterica subsp. enterica serovar Concord]|nr:hypothetical protein [Salmonella enterica subsp. enterica serovar Concord]
MQKSDREAAIAANRNLIPPEQMLILCEELKALERKILDNRGIHTKADILAFFRGWRESKKKAAQREITLRKWRNEKY